MKRKTIIGVIIISAIIGGVISTKVVSDNSKSNNIINVESKSGTSEAVNDNSEVVNDNSEVVNGNSEKVNDDSEVVNNNSEVVNNNSEKNKLDDGNKNSIEEDNKITSNAEYEIALNKAEEALNLGKFHKALDIINSINFKSDIDDLNWRMEHLKGNIELAIYDEEIISNAENYLKNGDYKKAEETIKRVKGLVIESHEKRAQKVKRDIKENNNNSKEFTYEDAVNRLRKKIGDNYNFEYFKVDEDGIGNKTYYISAYKENSLYGMTYVVSEHGEIRQAS